MNELTIHLQSNREIPLYEQIYIYIRNEIRNNRLPFGEKLPSTRALSAHLGVSRSTVELAYEQLLSEGYIEAFPCKGYYVSEIEALYQQENWTLPIEENVVEEKKKYQFDFSPYGIDSRSFPHNTWRKLTKEILVDREDLFQSGHPQGEFSFRRAIKNYLHQARGVQCKEEQIVIGAGNDYLLMMLCMMMGTKKIAFENPTYKQAVRLFENHSYEICTVQMDRHGMKTDDLERSGAQLTYVMPSHQFPLGIVMPIKRRMELLNWALSKEERYIIEDDYDSEFRYKGKPIPALQGFDTNGKVVYLGTFSRSIAPSIRISYMVLPYGLLKKYREKCSFLSCTVSKVDQYMMQNFIEKGYFERHLNKMRGIYKNRHDLLISNLKPLLNQYYISGENAGVHLLLKSKYGTKESELIERAESRSLKVYGLSRYHIGKICEDSSTILLGYANMEEKEIVYAVRELCEVLK